MSKGEHAKVISPRRRVKFGVLMGGAAGLVALGSVAMAQVGSSAFNATVTPTPLSVNAATVTLTDGTTSTLAGASLTNFIPGDYSEQLLDLKNGSSVNFGSITIGAEACDTTGGCTPSSSTVANSLITGTNGMTVTGQSCSVAWTASTSSSGVTTYTCSGTASYVLGSSTSGVTLNSLVSSSSPTALTLASTSSALVAGDDSYLMFTIALPSAASQTDEGLSDTVAFNFTGTTAATGAVA